MRAGASVKIGFLGGGMMAQIGHLSFYEHDRRCEVAVVCESSGPLTSGKEGLGDLALAEEIWERVVA